MNNQITEKLRFWMNLTSNRRRIIDGRIETIEPTDSSNERVDEPEESANAPRTELISKVNTINDFAITEGKGGTVPDYLSLDLKVAFDKNLRASVGVDDKDTLEQFRETAKSMGVKSPSSEDFITEIHVSPKAEKSVNGFLEERALTR